VGIIGNKADLIIEEKIKEKDIIYSHIDIFKSEISAIKE